MNILCLIEMAKLLDEPEASNLAERLLYAYDEWLCKKYEAAGHGFHPVLPLPCPEEIALRKALLLRTGPPEPT